MKKMAVMIPVFILASIVLFATLASPGSNLTVTVQATVRSPSDDPYYAEYQGGYKDTRIPPDERVYFSSESHGAPYRGVTMRSGILVTGIGYGFYSLKGAIGREKLLEACPSLPLLEDWEFCLDMFSTDSGNKADIYLDLVIFADSMTAKAVMYMFREGYAHPEIREADVAIGEVFGFGIEF